MTVSVGPLSFDKLIKESFAHFIWSYIRFQLSFLKDIYSSHVDVCVRIEERCCAKTVYNRKLLVL